MKAKEGLLDKAPVFEYAGASEDITDTSKTFEELRIEKATDFPELDDSKRVSWTVEYGKITKAVPNPKGTSIGKMKADIEISKEFLEALKKAKDKNPICKVKPKITAQSKGIASYKGIFRTLEEAEASDKHIRIVPAKDGNVYEMRTTEAGRFIAPISDIKELSEVSAGYTPAFPPLPCEQFAQIIAFFRHYMRHDRESEVMVYLYWDKEEQRYQIRVPLQNVGKAHISVIVPPDESIDADRYVHVADIHSHNSMPARFSITDDQDELATRAYVVVGLLQQANPSIAARISVGGRYVPIDARQVIEISRELCLYNADFPAEWLSMVHEDSRADADTVMFQDIPFNHRLGFMGWLRSPFRNRKGA